MSARSEFSTEHLWARENFLWGAPRIHGKLLMLGFTVSQATVSRYMPPTNRRPGQSWRTFMRNQAMAFGHRELARELTGARKMVEGPHCGGSGKLTGGLILRPSSVGMLLLHRFFDHVFPVALNLPDFGFRLRRLAPVCFHFFRFVRHPGRHFPPSRLRIAERSALPIAEANEARIGAP
jgi:hypothetical protein